MLDNNTLLFVEGEEGGNYEQLLPRNTAQITLLLHRTVLSIHLIMYLKCMVNSYSVQFASLF